MIKRTKGNTLMGEFSKGEKEAIDSQKSYK